jgi:hypothetical protein
VRPDKGINVFTRRPRERHVLEQAIRSVAQARNAYDLIDALTASGISGDGPPMLAAKELRAELLRVKGDLERELSGWVLDCRRCHRRVHWVSGVGSRPGHWGHAEPAPRDHVPVI